ncbi:MAG: hypothetical protein HY696_05275 [Deltaproteobacteria bacterium]|nr:hypothetical protein [Deltaproteobacteria bacterium]
MHRTPWLGSVHHLTVVGLIGLLAACGSSVTGTVSTGGASTTSDSGVTTIDQLPLATSPVQESSTSNSLAKSLSKATTGINLGTMGSDTFDTNSSLAACEMSARFRHALNSAAQGDRVLCYIQQTFEANQELGIDLYNGQPHIFDLDMVNEPEGRGGGPSKVQIQITRGADGSITDFAMHACRETTQNEYIHQTVTDGAFAMATKHNYSDESGEGSESVTVNGTLESGHFVGSKTIAGTFRWESSAFSGHGSGTVTQTPSTIDYSGYESGDYVQESESGSFSHRIFSAAQLIDGNDVAASGYNLGLLALGDGAAHAIISGNLPAQGGASAGVTT